MRFLAIDGRRFGQHDGGKPVDGVLESATSQAFAEGIAEHQAIAKGGCGKQRRVREHESFGEADADLRSVFVNEGIVGIVLRTSW